MNQPAHPSTAQIQSFQGLILNITILMTIIWTLVVSGSLLWNLHFIQKDGIERAYAEAKANINKDRTFRRWATEHGGVYVPISDKQKSIPWLSHVPGRDITATNGLKLTLLNPASMLRQIMDRYAKDYGIKGRITGLKYLNPGNAPDPWEKEQLVSFTAGKKKEIWAIENINNQPHLRYLQAMYMEPGCEKCHAILGYKIGDMRGATGVNLPLESYYQQIDSLETNALLSHLIIWLLGIVGIVLASRVIQKGEKKRQREESKRKEAEELTIIEKNRAESYVNLVEVILVAIDFDGCITMLNRKGHQVLGYKETELIGKNWFKICLPPEEYNSTLLTFKKIINEEAKPIEYSESDIITKTSEKRCIAWHSTVIKDTNGLILGLLSSGEDITERKKSEIALKESEERFKNLSSMTSEGIVIHDNGKILDVNQAFINLLGYSNPEELIGKHILDVTSLTPESLEISKKYLYNMQNDKYDIEMYNKEKKKIYAQTRGVNVIFKKQKARLALLYDITERKLSEKKVSSEKERLQVTLRSIGDGVITTDVHGNIVIMNPVAERLTGWSQVEAQGKPIETVFTIINELTRSPSENPVAKVLHTKKMIELENHTLLISRDRTERIIADSAAPIMDNDGNTYGVVLVFRDMTEKQKLLDSIQRTTKLESLGVLAGGIAHDFNNLLGGIFGYLDLALNLSVDEKMTSYLLKAKNTIDRARGLTHQLLTFALGGAPIKKIESLFPFIKETALFALSGSNVSCEFDISPNLLSCKFDKNQIGQVIDNLIINAQQAMPIGGIIELTAENYILKEKEHPLLPIGNYIKISVKDRGTGISKEILPKIFDPFFTTKPKGHGLGLASCYSIISRHGGCIDVESEIGVGSTFHVYLPATQNTISDETSETEILYRGHGVFLIMDDEEILQEIIGEMLQSLGYSVVCVKNGTEAISVFKSELNANRTFAGMIFDLTIPGAMGGMETIGEIRKLDPKVPVFVSSGYSDDPAIANPKDYGFTASICKPFERSQLIKMLQNNLK